MRIQYWMILLAMVSVSKAFGQSAIDGYMKGSGNTDFALTYSQESYDIYRFGGEDQELPNTLTSLSLFVEHAFSDSLDVVLSLPYLRTDAGNGGLQDAILAAKYRNVRNYYDHGALSVITAVGASFPASNYPTDVDKPIGEKGFTFQARLLAQYESKSGFFVHLQSGYDLRISPATRNAIPAMLRVGFGSSKLYVDTWLDFYHTFNAGVDTQIAGGEGAQWLKLGGTIYYPVSPKFGVFVGGAHILSGQNVGLASRFNVGVVYKKQGKHG